MINGSQKSQYRDLSTLEVIAITTLKCCANAIEENAPKLWRRLNDGQKSEIETLCKALQAAVQCVIEESPDTDRQEMIRRRMGGLKLQFGNVEKHPANLLWMTAAEAELFIGATLEKCDIDCPCIFEDKDGDRTVSRMMVKQCETRKALRRIGLAEEGLGTECPYQYLIGGKRDE